MSSRSSLLRLTASFRRTSAFSSWLSSSLICLLTCSVSSLAAFTPAWRGRASDEPRMDSERLVVPPIDRRFASASASNARMRASSADARFFSASIWASLRAGVRRHRGFATWQTEPCE